VARRLLGAPEDTKVLLAVDEIAKFAEDLQHVRVVNALISRLCRYSDRDPRLYLTLSAYGARDIATFATGSNRPILLQPLPPIFPVAPMLPGHTEVLPPVLRVFADEKLRMQLPAWGRPLYARLSRILLSTGGHPRSVRDVLAKLRSAFPAGKVFEQINGTDRLIDPAAFVRLLETELTENELESKCSNAISGVAPFSAIHLRAIWRSSPATLPRRLSSRRARPTPCCIRPCSATASRDGASFSHNHATRCRDTRLCPCLCWR
jgi:hypothetical protein